MESRFESAQKQGFKIYITNKVIFILYLSSDFVLLLPSCFLSEEVSPVNTLLQQTCAHKGGHGLCRPAWL